MQLEVQTSAGHKMSFTFVMKLGKHDDLAIYQPNYGVSTADDFVCINIQFKHSLNMSRK